MSILPPNDRTFITWKLRTWRYALVGTLAYSTHVIIFNTIPCPMCHTVILLHADTQFRAKCELKYATQAKLLHTSPRWAAAWTCTATNVIFSRARSTLIMVAINRYPKQAVSPLCPFVVVLCGQWEPWNQGYGRRCFEIPSFFNFPPVESWHFQHTCNR